MGNLLRGIGKAAGLSADVLTGYQADKKAKQDEMARSIAAQRQDRLDRLTLDRGTAAINLDNAQADATRAKPATPMLHVSPGDYIGTSPDDMRQIGEKPDPYHAIDPNSPEGIAAAIAKSQGGYHPPPSGSSEDRTLVPVQQPDGSVIYMLRSQAVGQQAPRPGTTGSAALKKGIATNQTQLATIDDAMKELDAHPSAVGVARGVGEMIPLLGGVQDAVNQRVDKAGVPARASIANIGSLVIHDRSGAAVTVSEYPRLKPFIPSAADTPDAVRMKLTKLRQAILEETGNLQEQVGQSSVPAPGQSPPTSRGATGQSPVAAKLDADAWTDQNPQKPGETVDQWRERYNAYVRGGR